MAHMFRVDYITNHVSGMVQSGKVIVVADSHDQAHDVVCQQLQLPPSRTRCEAVKIKPPCYELESHESFPDKKSTRTPQREQDSRVRFSIGVLASNVVGHNERQVLRKLGEELIARGMRSSPRHHIQIEVDCWPSNGAGKSSAPMNALEKIEMFGTRTGRVQGGQVRGR